MARRPRLRPNPGDRRSRRLAFSGYAAWDLFVRDLALVASVGHLRQTVDALTVEVEYDRIVLHACVVEQDAETIIDLETVRGELEQGLEVCVAPAPEVLLKTTVGINGPEWDGFWHMSIYKVHWSTREGEHSEDLV